MDHRPWTNYAATFATQIRPGKVTRKVEDIVERATTPNANALLFNTLDDDFVLPNLSGELPRLVYKDNSLDSDYDQNELLNGNGKRFELMHNLRTEALKYFFWVIDLTPGTSPTEREMELFEICLPYINVVFDEYGDREKRVIAEKIRELVLDKARDQIEYFKQNRHEFKNLFRVADIDRDAVIKYSPHNKLLTVSRDETKDNLPADTPERYAFVRDIMARLRTPEGRGIVDAIFDKNIAPRNVNNGTPLADYKRQLIDKLLGQTDIYLVKDGLYLVPGLPDVLLHTRRNVTRHFLPKEGAPYGLWFGELFLKKIYEEHGFETVARIMLEGAIRFDKTDAQVQMMGRDEAFWQEMAKVAHAIEPMHPRRPPNEQYLRIERVYRKALQLEVDNFNRRGMVPLLLHFLYRSYNDLEVLFKQYPDADDNEMVRRSWPIILKHADELIFIDAFNKSGIKDIYRTYDVYCGNVRRFTPDGKLLIPQHSKPSRQPTSSELQEEQPILNLTMKARDPKLLRKLFDEYLRFRFERIGVPKPEIDAFRERHIAYIMNDMHIDVVRNKNGLIPHTSTNAHARSGWTRKFDYDGKLYGVWVPEPRMRALSLAKKGPEILAWILLEEAQHFSPDGEIYKSHPRNKEKIFERTNDYREIVEHGAVFETMMSTLYHLIDQGQKAYPDFNDLLRTHSIQRTNNPEMRIFEDSVKYFLDTNIRSYFENPSIDYQEIIKETSYDIAAIMKQYMISPDMQLQKYSLGIANAILTYPRLYKDHRVNNIRFEKGYEIAYLKSA
jgi:hypothetical protein